MAKRDSSSSSAKRRRLASVRAEAIAAGTERFLSRGFSPEEAKSYATLFYEEGLKTRRELSGLRNEIQQLEAAGHA
ncbi:MAG: hypothetical protein KJ062_11445 [Thermoanaerobaculia bacterium]|nr:hypothetical protein [Thermoanaerobaculia bacterium]